MTDRDVARGVTIGRVGLGLAILVAPRVSGRALLGSDAERPVVTLLSRALGVRDVAVGAGGLAALQAGDPAARWLLAGAACDTVDALAFASVGDSIPAVSRWGTLALAAGGAVLGGRLSRRVV